MCVVCVIERETVRSGDKKPVINCHVGVQVSISTYQDSISGMSV